MPFGDFGAQAAAFAGARSAVSEFARAQRIGLAVWRFVRKKPLGAVGMSVVLIWVAFAIGTIGDEGGWLGIGRYESREVFERPNKSYAYARAAPLLDGVSIYARPDDLLALFATPTFLGPLAESAGVTGALHEIVLDGVVSGDLFSTLIDPAQRQLVAQDDLYVYEPNPLATGIDHPLATAILEGPSGEHWLGTDRAGRDIYARLAEGSRLSLRIGVLSALLATIVGLVIGMAAGFFRGRIDMFGNRLMDALQAFPPLVLLLLIAAVTSTSITMTILALALIGVAGVQRVVRASVFQASEEQYVEAARAIGAGSLRIIVRHILPNVMAPIVVVFTASIGTYILAEASLSFLGLGPVEVSWGRMISDGREFIISGRAPWLSLWSGLAITSLVFGFNVMGDALRDYLDPHLRGR